MKQIVVVILIVIFASSLAAEFNINGVNDIEYVYKAAEDSLNHFLKDEFSFRMNYDKFTFGMKFIAELPEYDDFQKVQFLNNDDISYRWDERFLVYDSDNLYLRGGNFEENFGTGIILRAYEDEDFDIDTRLEGGLAKYDSELFKLTALYGTLASENRPDKNNLAYGLNLETDILNNLQLAGSAVSYRNIYDVGNQYSTTNVLGGRLSYFQDWFDVYAEAANLQQEDTEFAADDGYACYTNLNTYFSKFSLSAGYKNYKDFDFRMNDLPTLNHSGEPISENLDSGFDETGFMGEFRYNPNYDNELILNYSEAWNEDDTIQLSDLYAEYRRDFANWSFTASYEQIEKLEEPISLWDKEMKPSLMADITLYEKPVYLKFEYKINDEKHGNDEKNYYEPLLQTDFEIGSIGLSLISQFKYEKLSEITDNEAWIGAEIVKDINDDSQLKVFVGKEKGGKICRNGTCRYQSAFEGLRLELTTNF